MRLTVETAAIPPGSRWRSGGVAHPSLNHRL